MANVFKKLVTGIADKGGDLGGWMNIFENIFGLLGRKSASSTDDQKSGIKAGIFGIGEEDENLYLNAITLAVKLKLMDPPKDFRSIRKNISAIGAKLNPAEKIKLLQIIGIGEQSVTITAPPAATKSKKEGKAGSKSKKEQITFMGNMRGALIVSLIANIDSSVEEEVNEVVDFLRNSGVLSTAIDDIKHFWSMAKPLLVSNWNKLKISEQTRKAVLWYIGAMTIEEAEVIVSAKERALEIRRQQTWYERNYGNRAYIWRWRILFATSIVALTYILTR